MLDILPRSHILPGAAEVQIRAVFKGESPTNDPQSEGAEVPSLGEVKSCCYEFPPQSRGGVDKRLCCCVSNGRQECPTIR